MDDDLYNDDLGDEDFYTDEKDSVQESIIDSDDLAADAYIDGQMDADYASGPYVGYGLSADEDELTDAQKELYDTEYLAGYQAEETQRDLDDDGELTL